MDQICQIWWNSYLHFSKNSTKIQATSSCNERPLHQKPAQGKIPTCQNHSVEHLACTVSLHFQRDSEDQRDSVSFSSLEFSHVSTVRLARCAQPLLPLWYNPNILSKLIKSIFGFYSNYFSSQNNSVFSFEPRWIAKQVPQCFWLLTSTQHPWIVLCTHNLEPSGSTLLLFKYFKIHSLHVWTRFAKFGENHIYTSPKIQQIFRQPLNAMRVPSTKNQLKEKSLDARIILSNTWHALFLFIFS